MATAATAAVNLVRALDNADHLFLRMKTAAEKAENIWTERIAILVNDNGWTRICIECWDLGALALHHSIISDKIEYYQNKSGEYSMKIKELQRCLASVRTTDAEKGRKVQKKKMKLEYRTKEETEISFGEEDNELKAHESEIIEKKTELKTTKQNLVVVGQILKFLKDALHFCDKALNMVEKMFILRVCTLQADFVEVVEMMDVNTIERIYEMSRCFVGLNLKFAIGSLVAGDSLEYIRAEITRLSQEISDLSTRISKLGTGIRKPSMVALDVKPGDLYELSIDDKGLCHFRQLSPVEALP